LAEAGCNVIPASDGDEALRLADVHGPSIDALVSDVMMPRLSGPALARRLSERNPRLRVVLISGYARETIDTTGFAAESFTFLEKPFTPQALLAALGQPRASAADLPTTTRTGQR
jgi:two-component system cell cycle sensor histidine kinase/response regulator CckA